MIAALLGYLLDDAAAAAAFFDSDFICQAANRRFSEMTNVPEQDLIGRSVADMPVAFAATALEALREVAASGSPLLDREFAPPPAGSPEAIRYWSASWHPMRAADGRFLGVTCVLSDRRKRIADALRSYQVRLDLAEDAAGVGSWVWNLQTNEVLCSPGYGPLYGLPSGDHAPSFERWLELVHPVDRARLRDEVEKALAGANDVTSEFRVIWPDGSSHWLFGHVRVFRDRVGRPVRLLGVNMDITGAKLREQALKESEERFRSMADTAPVMIVASGPQYNATFFNQGWLTFTGRTLDQELGEGWTAGLHPDDRDTTLAALRASFEARRYCHIEYRLRRADGEYRWVHCNGVPQFQPDGAFAGYIGCATDITDLKRSYEAAFARQKLESLGVLAGGVAHDFNNLLSSILADTELLHEELPDGGPARETAARIGLVARRAAEIVGELMAYAGKGSAAFEPVDLSALTSEMLQLLKVSISKHAGLRIHFPPDLPPVAGNASQLRQVIMNLILNASESLGGADGTISVTGELIQFTADSASAGGTNLSPGDYIRLEVRDTGSGMSEDIRAKIFDPFFTTKAAGRGLGLAAVQGIVRSHGGAIHVESAPDRGSAFAMLLPRWRGAVAVSHTASP
ncbi:MAG TPA: PAS domain-containing protein [Bryobacteraceae bacterium]